MYTIYRVYNKIYGKEKLIGVTEDFETLCTDFLAGRETGNRALDRIKRRDAYAFERLEDTDNAPRRYAYYSWPQLKRVEYSDVLIQKSLKRGFSKYVNHVVDRLVSLFPDNDYSFKLSVVDETIAAIVFFRGKAIEGYTFKHSGAPDTRTFIE